MIGEALERFKAKVRWHGWSHGKIPLCCTILFYLVLKHGWFGRRDLADLLLFLLFSIVSGIYGYLVNDLCDLEIDRRQGKRNVFLASGRAGGAAAVLGILLLGGLLGARFLSRPGFAGLWLVWVLLATFYSAPPLRLKERGAAGLLANILSQYTIPLLLCFAAFGAPRALEAWGLALLATLSGLAQELGHQLSDLERDASTSTATLAVRIGQRRTARLYRLMLRAGLLAVGGMLIVMALGGVRLRLGGMSINPLLPPLALYLVLVVLTAAGKGREREGVGDPYYQKGRQDLANLTYVLFPNFLLPLYLACLLALAERRFGIVALLYGLFTFITFPRANPLRPLRLIAREVAGLWRRG